MFQLSDFFSPINSHIIVAEKEREVERERERGRKGDR